MSSSENAKPAAEMEPEKHVKPEITAQSNLSPEEVIAMMMGFGYEPNSKKNAIVADYVPTLRHEAYDFIKPEQFDMSGRAVFITGASRGLGRAFAVSYAKAGASKIGIGARSKLDEVVKEVQEAAKSAGRKEPEVLALDLDVTDEESVKKAATEVEESFGRVDILVNNAGFMEPAEKITEVDPKAWWRTFEVNLFGTFLVTRNFIPLILKSADSLKTVANISSILGLTFCSGASAYQMSKFAQLRFAQLCNAEYENEGLMAFSFHPGGTATDLSANAHEYWKQFYIDTPEKVGNNLVWLTAERREWLKGRYIHGQLDMEELEAKKPRIVAEDHFKMRLAVGLD